MPATPAQIDRIRYALGDMDGDLLEDLTIETAINRVLENQSDADLAEAYATRTLALGLIVRYAAMPSSISEGGVTISYSDRLEGWREVVSQVDRMGGGFQTVTPTRGTYDDAEFG